MARKPVLIELLLAALDDVGADVLSNPSQVYLYSTNKLLVRNIDTKRTFTSTVDKLYFLCELAWEMIDSSNLRVHYQSIPERLRKYFGDRIKDQHELDLWDYDLRTQTLLHRDAAGYYEFAHKSLAEYFVALKFAAELGALSPVFAQTYCETDGKSCVMPIKQLDVIDLASTFGKQKLTNAMMYTTSVLLLDMLDKNAVSKLRGIIDNTKLYPPDKLKYVGGNAATLLNMLGASFKNAKFAKTVLCGANFSNGDLTGADFRGAYVREADFRHCVLANADFRNADLSRISIKPYSYYDLDWSKDNKYIAACGQGTVAVWNSKWKIISKRSTGLLDASVLKFDSNSKKIYVGGFTDIDVLSVNRLDRLSKFQGHTDPIHAVDYNPITEQLASGGQDDKIILWSAHDRPPADTHLPLR